VIPQLRQAALFVVFGAWQLTDKRGEFYNILWMLVFGFATLNILALVTRSLEPSGRRRRMAVGEMLAVLVVVTCLVLLSWEMLQLFHIFPIRLNPR
jgi:Na+/serine symporter